MLAAGISLLLVTACSNASKPDPSKAPDADTPTVAETPKVSDTTSTCPDDGPRFEISGKCKGRAINYIDEPASDSELDFYNQATGETCRWELMETAFATDALLYQGVVCGANKASLELAVGAQSSNLFLVTSPFGADMNGSETPVAIIFSADPENPTANIEYRTREAIEDPEMKDACTVFPAPADAGHPQGSYFVDVPEDMRPPVDDGPYALCGPYGFNGDETSYWMARDGFSWFIQLGQEPVGVAPGSFKLITPEAK